MLAGTDSDSSGSCSTVAWIADGSDTADSPALAEGQLGRTVDR